jgi:hypothetical protein
LLRVMPRPFPLHVASKRRLLVKWKIADVH